MSNSVPRTDSLLADARLAAAIRKLGKSIVKAAIRAAQQSVRVGNINPDEIVDAVLDGLPPTAATLRPVINATGVLLHTNLGRAPLSHAACEALVAAAGVTDVEYDPVTGRRAKRGRGALEALAAAVPDAGGVHIVNNNAAGLVLVATALAQGRQIILSRGELVEVGDGFRLPDLLESTGARLREVGTTNRTTLQDYRRAIGTDTAFILKIHPSNFRVEGFTESVPITALASLGVPVVFDIGSGLLAPDPLLPDEPDARTALRDGANLVTASGDKLLGGPQAGLLLGDADLVNILRRHPLARALRVDKLTLAAFEATLRGPATPTHEALHADVAALRIRAEWIVANLRARLGSVCMSYKGPPARAAAGSAVSVQSRCCQVVPSEATVGGGGAPGVVLPSIAVALPSGCAERLRQANPPVVTRVVHGHCLVDLRTVSPSDDELLATTIAGLA